MILVTLDRIWSNSMQRLPMELSFSQTDQYCDTVTRFFWSLITVSCECFYVEASTGECLCFFFQESVPVQVADVDVVVNRRAVEIVYYQKQDGRQVSRAYYQPTKVMIHWVALQYMQSLLVKCFLMTIQTSFRYMYAKVCQIMKLSSAKLASCWCKVMTTWRVQCWEIPVRTLHVFANDLTLYSYDVTSKWVGHPQQVPLFLSDGSLQAHVNLNLF